MGQDGIGKTPAQNQLQGQGQDRSVADPAQDDQGPQEPTLPTTANDQPAADDLLHAAYVLPPDMIANVELTLDHLSTTVDLFDVPPFDYGAGPLDHGDGG
jgi:hypothetical protein